MTHVANFTVQSSQVTSDHTDFVVKLDLSDLQSLGDFWSTVANGGGDIRCYKSDGTTELAREVDFCDTATDTGIVYVKFAGTLSSSSNTEIQVHADGTSSEPAATATYGRNNVWTDFTTVIHFRNPTTDSTGRGSVSLSGTYTENTDNVDFNGGQVVVTLTAGDYDVSGGYSVMWDATIDAIAGQGNFDRWLEAGGSFGHLRSGTTDSGRFDHGGNHRIIANYASNFMNGTRSLHHQRWADTSGDCVSYVDGSSVASSAGYTIDTPSPGTALGIMGRGSVGSQTEGALYEFRLSRGDLGADRVADEYTNHNTPSTFYTASAVSSGTTINAGLESISLSANAATVSSDREIGASLETLVLTELSAAIASDRDILASLESITLSEFAASVNAGYQVSANIESVTLTENPASITTGSGIQASTESIGLTGNTAGVFLDLDIAAALESLQISTSSALVGLGSQIQASLEGISLSASGATIELDVAVSASVENLVMVTQAAAVALGVDVQAALESLILTESGATVAIETDLEASLEAIVLTPRSAAVVGAGSVLTDAGLEYTLPEGLLNYTVNANRLHFTFPVSRIHFTIEED